MMGHKFIKGIMVVIVMAGSIGGSIVGQENRLADQTGGNESSQYLNEATTGPRGSSLSSSSNETSARYNEKKMIHRLIGGHVKLYPKGIEAKDERETRPSVITLDDDDGLSTSSAGNGREKISSTTKTSTGRRDDDDEEKKTLSQQVKEGKYGLIQNEIYPTAPKRPGIISYLGNPEVPKDNARNLGGLEEEEIWLAENHLLVLRGGNFPDHGIKGAGDRAKWPPIDDYKAPPRQVKIPERPEVPPPFPVQLAEGGPVQIFRANGSLTNVNDTADYEEYANYPEGFYPGETPFYDPSATNSTELGYPGNFSTDRNGSYLPPPFSGVQGTVGPFYPALPPGAVFLPPPSNRSDYEDEDQSIYYPPPYSFYYQRDNGSAVPPGPLVPGIILPPPPNFFAPLNEKKSVVKNETEKGPSTTTRATTTVAREEETSAYPPTTTAATPRRKTVTKPYKVRFSTTTQIAPTFATGTTPTTRVNEPRIKTIGRTKPREFSTIPPPATRFTPTPRYAQTSTSRPDKPTTITPRDYYDVQTEIENHLVDLGEPQSGPWSAIVGSTAVPLLAYYATTSSPLERTRSTEQESSPIHVNAKIPSQNQASYYFYEETVAKTTTDSPVVNYYETSTEEPSPYYNVEPITTQRQSKKQYYSVEMIPSQQTADDYDIKFSSLVKNAPSFNAFTSGPSRYNADTTRERSSSRTQSHRNLADNTQRYYEPVTLKPYYTTARPRFYYESSQSENRYEYREEQGAKSSPVYRYSYEATDYSNKRHRDQQARDEQPTIYADYQQPTGTANVDGGRYYEYDTGAVDPKVSRTQRIPYPGNNGGNLATNGLPIFNTTPNPHHAYYTKQDEQLLDDVTKQYFTIFGKKLANENGLQSTTPLYRLLPSTTTPNPLRNVNAYVQQSNRYDNGVDEEGPLRQSLTPIKVKVHYGDQTQRPYSLEGDTLVNYKHPLPEINPDAEFISIPNKPIANSQRPAYRPDRVSPIADPPNGNYVPASNPRETLYRGSFDANPPLSLANDIAVNYRDPRPPINPDAEFVTPVHGHGNQGNRGGAGGSYFAYQLPGNGGHFYFLTPRAIPQRQDREYNIYPKTTPPRIIRRRRGPTEG